MSTLSNRIDLEEWHPQTYCVIYHCNSVGDGCRVEDLESMSGSAFGFRYLYYSSAQKIDHLSKEDTRCAPCVLQHKHRGRRPIQRQTFMSYEENRR